MRELHCGFSVRVSTDLCGGMYHAVERSEQVVLPNAVRQFAGFDEIHLPWGQFARRGFLLQDDKVAADLGSGMVGKQVVRKPHGRHDVAPLHQPFAHGTSLLGIEHALRSDECDDAALAYRIDRLHEEVVVQRACSLTPHGVGMGREKRVEQRYVPERDVAHGHIVMTGILGFDRFISLRPHAASRMQVFEDESRRGVFLEAGYLGGRLVYCQDFRKDTRAGTGIENPFGSNPSVPYRIDNGIRDFGRRIECRQHRVSDSVDVAFVLLLVRGTGFYDLVQLGDECIHIVARFVFRRFQHLLDRPEAAVCGKSCGFLRGEFVRLPFERESCFQRVDISAKMRLLIVSHLPAEFERFLRARCRAIRIRVSRRNHP